MAGVLEESQFKKATTDLRAGLEQSEVWRTIGSSDLRSRYSRSTLGQFWHTLSLAFLIAGIGVLYSQLLGLPTLDYIVYISVTFPIWFLIAGILTDSCVVFVVGAKYMFHSSFPYSIYVYAMIWRNLLLFVHSIVVTICVLLVSGWSPGYSIVLLPVGLMLFLLNAVWIGILLGLICVRFRDVQHIVASIVQVAMFMTPVMYKPAGLGSRMQDFLDFNPFASFLAILRDPILGVFPRVHDWAMVLGVLVVGWSITVTMFSRFRRQIVYWT